MHIMSIFIKCENYEEDFIKYISYQISYFIFKFIFKNKSDKVTMNIRYKEE